MTIVPSAAADLVRHSRTGKAFISSPMRAASTERALPFCVEMPTWLFGRPVLLKCAPPLAYFKPNTVGPLNAVKGLHGREPYPRIYHQ
jgi:hypothetical protein